MVEQKDFFKSIPIMLSLSALLINMKNFYTEESKPVSRDLIDGWLTHERSNEYATRITVAMKALERHEELPLETKEDIFVAREARNLLSVISKNVRIAAIANIEKR